jgi:DNA-binding transcriptional ArsR family regulator
VPTKWWITLAGVLRIHFSQQDLLLTRLAAGAEPSWELLLSLRGLLHGDSPPHIADWRSSLDPTGSTSALRLVNSLRADSPRPDLLARRSDSPGHRAVAGKVAATPKVAGQAPHPALPLETLLASSAQFSAPVKHELYALTEAYWRDALLPYWPQIRAAVQTDLPIRVNQFAYGGIEQCLMQLHPLVRWKAPVLEIPHGDGPGEDLVLDGRGMRLVPSFFCGTPLTAPGDPGAQPVLVFGVDRRVVAPHSKSARGGMAALRELVGHTRAKVLAAIAVNPCTTTQLASHLVVSAASVSQHAAVLRKAGLITSQRSGSYVVHAITPTGKLLADKGARK